MTIGPTFTTVHPTLDAFVAATPPVTKRHAGAYRLPEPQEN
jgi:hypothetical protein